METGPRCEVQLEEAEKIRTEPLDPGRRSWEGPCGMPHRRLAPFAHETGERRCPSPAMRRGACVAQSRARRKVDPEADRGPAGESYRRRQARFGSSLTRQQGSRGGFGRGGRWVDRGGGALPFPRARNVLRNGGFAGQGEDKGQDKGQDKGGRTVCRPARSAL